MRRRHIGVALLAGLAGLGAAVTTEAKKKPGAPGAPEPDASLAAKVKRLDTQVRDLQRRLEEGGL